jgi:bacteriocin-like protein
MEIKWNDSCPLGRELETDELKNVSGGGSIGAGIQAGVNTVIK